MNYAGGKKERVKESLPGESEKSPPGGLSQDAPFRRPPFVAFDYREFAHHLAGLDLTEDEQRQVLEALAWLLVGIIDLGLEVHPAQAACGQNGKNARDSTLAALFAVECEDMKHCEEYAGGPQGAAAGESEE